MKQETLYDLQKIWRQGGIADLLLEGDSGRKEIHLSTLEIRNQLLQWLETEFPGNISLLFRQTQWTKYFYSEEDTDIIVALKTVFNLLLQIHLANTLDKGPTRHFNWPLNEIIELNRHKSLLMDLLPKSFSNDLFKFLSYYWPNSDKLVQSEDEENNIETAWLVVSEKVLESPIPSQDPKKPVIIFRDDNETLGWLLTPLILREDYIASHVTNFLRLQGTFARICRLINMYQERIWQEEALKKSLVISEFAKFIRDCFFYLDYLEARLDTPGLFSQPLTQKINSLLDGDKFQILLTPLKSQLSIEDGQFFVKDRLYKAEERRQELKQGISTLSINNPDNRHKRNGLQKAYENLGNLNSSLPSALFQDFNLKDYYGKCISAVDKLIDSLKEKFPQSHSKIIFSLKNLRGNFEELLCAESPEEITTEYLHLKNAYLRLTRQIPKTCRAYLQEHIQALDQKYHYLLSKSTGFAKVYSEAEQKNRQNHESALASTLGLIQTEVGILIEEVQNPKKVNWWWPIVPSYPMNVETKADYLDNLLWLEDALVAYIKVPSDASRKKISTLIFDLRRLERNRGELNRNPAFKKIWVSINEQIEVLRERDIVFNRSILSSQPEEIIEDKAWCQWMGIEKPLPPLSAPTESQILKNLNEMTLKMRNQIMQVINNQSKDSKVSRNLGLAVDGFYYQALRQEPWQEYSFSENETTETYTIKLLLNILFHIRQATREGIQTKGWFTQILSQHKSEWLMRLMNLPVFEISRLISELPVFLASSGLESLGTEVINIINIIKTMAPGYKQELIKIAKVTVDMNSQPTATPLNSLAYSGIIGTDLAQLMLLISSGEKFFAKNGRIRSAHQIVKPNWQNFRDEKAVVETGRLLLNCLIKLDNFSAKTGLTEHKILVDRVGKTAAKKARQADEDFKDVLCNKNWEIVQGQPFLIKRMQAQEQSLQTLKQELVKLEEGMPPASLTKLLIAMRGSDHVDLEELELKHGNELKQFLWSYLSQKQAETQAAVDKLAASHAEKLAKLLAAGESEHKIEKQRLAQLNQLAQYKQKLSDFSHFNLKNIDELFTKMQSIQSGSLSVTDDFRLTNMAAELSEHVQRLDRSMNSKKQHIQQAEHELLEKQCLAMKELVEQMDNLMVLAHQLHRQTNVAGSHKLVNLLRSLFQSKEVKGRHTQLEKGFKDTLNLYLLTYDTPKFKASKALQREMISLAMLIHNLPYINDSTRQLAQTAVEKAYESIVKVAISDLPKFKASKALQREIIQLTKLIQSLPYINDSTRRLAQTAVENAYESIEKGAARTAVGATDRFGLTPKAAVQNVDQQLSLKR